MCFPSKLRLLLCTRFILVVPVVLEIRTRNKQTLSHTCVGVIAFSHMGRESGYFHIRGRSSRFLIIALWLQSTWQTLKFLSIYRKFERALTFTPIQKLRITYYWGRNNSYNHWTMSQACNFLAQVPSKVVSMQCQCQISESEWDGSVSFHVWPRTSFIVEIESNDHGIMHKTLIKPWLLLTSVMSLIGMNGVLAYSKISLLFSLLFLLK
jgi:hypothetical protein